MVTKTVKAKTEGNVASTPNRLLTFHPSALPGCTPVRVHSQGCPDHVSNPAWSPVAAKDAGDVCMQSAFYPGFKASRRATLLIRFGLCPLPVETAGP